MSKIFDHSFSQDNGIQTTASAQPDMCSKAGRVNNRHYLIFSGGERIISDINLHASYGVDDIVNVFIVYKLSSYSGSYWTKNGLFGHDNGGSDRGHDKYISFSNSNTNPALLIGGTVNLHIVIGQNTANGRAPISNYQSKANCSQLHTWTCLSVH